MAYPTNKRGAFLALALSGGLWAWQNRDKISGWLQQQKGQLGHTKTFGSQSTPGTYSGSSSTSAPYGASTYGDTSTGSYTGATRRMDESGSPFGQGTMEGNEGRNSEI